MTVMDYELFEMDDAEFKTEYLEDGVELEHIGANFLPRESYEYEGAIYGNPESDVADWKTQDSSTSSGVSCELYVARHLLETDMAEKKIAEVAILNGWYSEGSGTALYDVGKVLTDFGLSVEYDDGLSIKDIAEMLENDEKVICALSSAALYFPDFAGVSFYGADHVVEVIGVDAENVSDVRIILNDPRAEHGGTVWDEKRFLDAWKASGCYAVSVKKPVVMEQ